MKEKYLKIGEKTASVAVAYREWGCPAFRHLGATRLLGIKMVLPRSSRDQFAVFRHLYSFGK